MILICDFSKQPDKLKLYESLKKLKPVVHQIHIKVDRETRSGQQNRYYWGVVIKMLSEYTGFDPNEMHEDLARRFLSYFKVIPTGEERTLTRKTSELDTKEFEDYLEQCRRLAAEHFDIIIPLPNEVLEV